MIDRTRNLQLQPTDGDWKRRGIRIGAVSYLNSKPLIHNLRNHCSSGELILDVPSRLADQLASGELDVALIPSIEAFHDPDYEIVSDACVATHGPVLSVKLYSRVHPGEIKTLALDEGSRTSASLARIMLKEKFGVEPKLEKLPLAKTTGETTADAILLIGDRAMFQPQEKFHTVWDLGEEWLKWTGLPFVFAMWVTRKGVELGDVETALSLARDNGLDEIEQIASDGAKQLSLDLSTARTYLKQNLYFRLGEAEKAGMKLFQQLAADNGLAPAEPVAFREARSESLENELAENVA